MKIAHHVPTAPHSAVVTPEYQAEVDASMERGRLRWESEQAALAKAERRRERLARRKPKTASQARSTKRKLREIAAEIEAYRQHLIEVHRVMVATGVPSTSRGRKSFRPVPKRGDLP